MAVLLTLAAAGFAEKPPKIPAGPTYTCKGLNFRIGTPENWMSEHDLLRMVSKGDGMGFRVTREPFLYAEKTLAKRWTATLKAAGFDAKVKTARAGKYSAYRAEYSYQGDAAGPRPIVVYRIRVPENEMLYNIAFSVNPGVEAQPYIDTVLAGFAYTGPKSEVKWQAQPVAIGRAATFKIPEGYVKKELKPRRRRPEVQWIYRKTMEGYTPKREAGRITLYAFNARARYEVPGGPVSGADLEKLVSSRWDLVKGDIAKPLGRPKSKNARAGEFKGRSLKAMGETKEGFVRVMEAFGTKLRGGFSVVICLYCDERELKLHKKLFKGMLKSLKAPKK